MSNQNYVNSPRCGEIWMCRMEDRGGSLQSGCRPVFILSNDKNNTHSSVLNIIPLTTKMNKRHLPVHVELWNYRDYGLAAPSTMMIEQITTVNAESIERRLGRIDDIATLRSINQAMRIQFPVISLVN